MNCTLLTLTLAGCGGSMSLTDKEVDATCQHVNDENWHSPEWNRSAQEECRDSRVNIADGQVPCTLGGLAGWCRLNEDGLPTGFHRGISTNWVDIAMEEIPLVEKSLVIHSGC